MVTFSTKVIEVREAIKTSGSEFLQADLLISIPVNCVENGVNNVICLLLVLLVILHEQDM